MKNLIASSLKKAKKPKPFTAWMLYDAADTYSPTLHHTRASAVSDKRDAEFLRDAKWRICRVRVSAL